MKMSTASNIQTLPLGGSRSQSHVEEPLAHKVGAKNQSAPQLEEFTLAPDIVIVDKGNRIKITEKWPLRLFCRTVFCSVKNLAIIVALLQVVMGLVTGGAQVVHNHDATHVDYLFVLMISMLSTVAGIATVASLGFRVKGCLTGTLIIVSTAAVVFLATTKTHLLPKLFGSDDSSQIIFHTNQQHCSMMEGKKKDECLFQHFMARLILLSLSTTNLVLAILAAGLICAEKFGKTKVEPEQSNI